jgi:hypothetical protein
MLEAHDRDGVANRDLAGRYSFRARAYISFLIFALNCISLDRLCVVVDPQKLIRACITETPVVCAALFACCQYV